MSSTRAKASSNGSLTRPSDHLPSHFPYYWRPLFPFCTMPFLISYYVLSWHENKSPCPLSHASKWVVQANSLMILSPLFRPSTRHHLPGFEFAGFYSTFNGLWRLHWRMGFSFFFVSFFAHTLCTRLKGNLAGFNKIFEEQINHTSIKNTGLLQNK